MNRYRARNMLYHLSALLFFLLLFLYTMAFPGNTSWFILIFFALLFVLLFLSTLFSWGASEVFLLNRSNHTADVEIKIRNRWGLPLFLPSLNLRLGVKGSWAETEIPVFFNHQFTVVFPDVHFPRGRYTAIELETTGKDYFGFFTHYSRKKLPAEFEIYPVRIPEKYRNRYLQKIKNHPSLQYDRSALSSQLRQIRAYRPQDPLKQIDWKTSARKREMMVKEYESEAFPTLTIIFIGTESLYFEKLLSLAYTLYLDLLPSPFPCKIKLWGNFEGKTEIKTERSAFLTIEPETVQKPVGELRQIGSAASGYSLVVAPQEFLSSLQQQTKKQIFLTENDLIMEEVNRST